MAKKGSGEDVDKASSTESERNIHQGPNRGLTHSKNYVIISWDTQRPFTTSKIVFIKM